MSEERVVQLPEEKKDRVKDIVTHWVDMIQRHNFDDKETLELSNIGINLVQMSLLMKELGYEVDPVVIDLSKENTFRYTVDISKENMKDVHIRGVFERHEIKLTQRL